MKKVGLILVFLTTLLTAACSKTLEVAANFPSYFSGQKIVRDIDFGSKYGSKLDVYMPDDENETHPVIVFIYGGAWEYGEKKIYRFVADEFTKKGYVVVIPDYVKYPKYKFPVWQDEAARAFVWTHANINQYKGSADQLFLMGHSARAQIGALLSTDPEYLAGIGGNRNWIKAFAGLAGPYDFTPSEADYMDMFSATGSNYEKIRVTRFIDGKQPPMLLLWGKKDDTVGEINITKVKEALDTRGGESKVIFYNDIGHIGIISSMAALSPASAPVAKDIDDWFKAHMTPANK